MVHRRAGPLQAPARGATGASRSRPFHFLERAPSLTLFLVTLSQLPAPQHRLDELAALKKQAEQLKADLARRKAQLAQLHQLREARGNLDPAVKELRDAIALWKPHEREASLPQEEEEERIDEVLE